MMSSIFGSTSTPTTNNTTKSSEKPSEHEKTLVTVENSTPEKKHETLNKTTSLSEDMAEYLMKTYEQYEQLKQVNEKRHQGYREINDCNVKWSLALANTRNRIRVLKEQLDAEENLYKSVEIAKEEQKEQIYEAHNLLSLRKEYQKITQQFCDKSHIQALCNWWGRLMLELTTGSFVWMNIAAEEDETIFNIDDEAQDHLTDASCYTLCKILNKDQSPFGDGAFRCHRFDVTKQQCYGIPFTIIMRADVYTGTTSEKVSSIPMIPSMITGEDIRNRHLHTLQLEISAISSVNTKRYVLFTADEFGTNVATLCVE